MGLYLSYDVGSISLKRALLDDKLIVSLLPYTRHHGHPQKLIFEDLNLLNTKYEKIDGISFTGCGGKQLASLLGGVFVNEFEALITGVKELYPECKTIIEIGGEHSKFVDIEKNDYYMNELCAAGTGSFLEQQASRFNLSIEEFVQLALKAKRPATIAGRCSVFAKSDMIHLQQEGTPDEEIALGLCFALVRSFKANIAKGREFIPPIIFCGGVAYNKAIIRAFKEMYNIDVIVPKNPESIPVIGAGIAIQRRKERSFYLSELKRILQDFLNNFVYKAESLPPLKITNSKLSSYNKTFYVFPKEKIDAAIGIDVGSISTNVVAIDSQKNLIAKVYIRTGGKPIEAVKKGICLLYEQVKDNLNVVAVGTTGSGRYLIGDLVGADTVINEITAQATAASHIDPEVDTIFEIGGQDSKYIYLQKGVVIDFEMNKICAAGTGSFLEEQAERFNIKIEEFGDISLCARSPINLGERCTVFMETNVYAHYQKGAKIEDIIGGLAYSIAINYLNRVVGRKKIGNRIFFQGAVAFNKGVVAAFEQLLGKPIIVPPHHEVTGAIGTAIVALRNSKGKSNFRGFKEIINIDYKQSSFECPSCPNHCEIRKVSIGNLKTLFYGGRCEKYEVNKKTEQKTPDFIKERNEILLNVYDKEIQKGKRIGIPFTMLTYEFYPFWKSFFTELGYSVILSDPTNKKIISDGLQMAVAETCFPMKVVLGHVINLLEKNVDYIFLPVIRDMPCDSRKIKGERRGSYICPYVQIIPYIVKSSLNINSELILSPVLNFSYKEYVKHYQLRKLGEKLCNDKEKIFKAINLSFSVYKKFKMNLKEKGMQILKSIPEESFIIILIGRPYNCYDKVITMDIPDKLRDLGFYVIPLDYLPLEKIDIFNEWPNLYWEFGNRIMSALKIINEDKRLYPVYITNFGCGPDSFLLQYFEREIKKPFLKIEVDEHTGTAGVITRCEAFADTLLNYRKLYKQIDINNEERLNVKISFKKEQKRKVFIPYMGDASYIGKSAFLSLGIEADVMLADQETLLLGRKYTLGKECYPFIITTGDMLKVLKYNDPEKVAFFMPLTYGPCRFGQYNCMQRILLNELGYKNIPIISPGAPESINFAKECGLSEFSGFKFFLTVLTGVIAVDYLGKLLRQIRPYEVNKGQTDKIYQKYLNKLCKIVETTGTKSLRTLHNEIFELLYNAKEEFIKIPIEKEDKPLIGIVGEIYVRNHPFSNNEIVKKIESLGGQVLLPPFIEWAYHTNATTKLDLSIKQKEYLKRILKFNSEYENKFKILVSLMENTFLILANSIFKNYLDKLHLKIEKIFEDMILEKEPLDIYPIWNSSEPYILKWFGEAALSIGKAIDWKRRVEIDGIINVLPFTCLPGNIVTAISNRIKTEQSLPWINIAYDGLEQLTTEIRIEAFFYQVRQYHLNKVRKFYN